jgi:hypothetical protein
MKRQVVRALVAVALGGFVFAAAGCGGGKSTTTQGGSAETTTGTSETTTEASGTTTTTGAAGALGALLSSKNCRDLVNSSANFSQAVAGMNAAGADLQKSEALMKQFADKTPADIRPDFEVLAAAYAKYAEALKGVDLKSGKAPSADVIARLQKLSTEIDQAKLSQASQHIAAWIQKNCSNGG